MRKSPATSGGLMNILGLHKGHDSSAALIVDGEIVADVAEERFSRIKHHAGLPFRAVGYCLEAGGLTMEDIDVIAIASRFTVPEYNILFDIDSTDERFQAPSWRRKIRMGIESFAGAGEERLPIYFKRYPLGKKTRIVHIDHHLSHAAAAYFTSGSSEKQVIVSADGLGDGYSAVIFRGEHGKLERIHEMDQTASIGWFYSNITEALGWWHGDGEGKTMGLAPYGNPKPAYKDLEPFYPKFSNGALVEAHDFGKSASFSDSGAIHFHFDEAVEIKKLLSKHSREDLAAACQQILEEQVMNIAYPWMEKEKTRNLTCSGGVFMNVKLNQRIWESGKVDKHWIYPNAGDSGLAVGAALQVYHDANPSAPIGKLEHLYHGPEYGDAEIEAMLKARHLSYKRVENPSATAAELLAKDRIVSWFQGRMESGPRALGNRSILMSANKAENKDIINAQVKFREGFRPFCPSLLWEKKADYLEKERDEFFMITSFTCTEAKRSKVPAVVHADGTLRPQTVKSDFNPKFHALISEFGRLTGEYMILNTSFNVMGEPVVMHPREAVRCFYDGGIDAMLLGSFLLEKPVAR